jgi:hypothetical protein
MSNLTVKNETRKKASRKKPTRKKTTRRSSSADTKTNQDQPVINSDKAVVKEESKKASLTQSELVVLVRTLEAKCDVLETKVANLENTSVNKKKLKSALKSVTKPSMAADLI